MRLEIHSSRGLRAVFWNEVNRQRRRDPGDRRRVFVHLTGRHGQQLGEIFAPLAASSAKLLDEYGEDELRIIHGFLGRLIDDSRDFLQRLPFDNA